uniref:Ovule protein n=1 Tax=Heterorhabditis bacteriophora TaxID=37862 RepID=A0A1I7X181_HETBA
MTSPYFLIFGTSVPKSSGSSSAPKCQTLQKRPKLSHSPPEREAGIDTSTTTPYVSPTTTTPRQYPLLCVNNSFYLNFYIIFYKNSQSKLCQLSSLTSSYFGWQLLNSYPSDEFAKKKEKEMETRPGHGEAPILPCSTDFKRVTIDSSLSALMCPRCNFLLVILNAFKLL